MAFLNYKNGQVLQFDASSFELPPLETFVVDPFGNFVDGVSVVTELSISAINLTSPRIEFGTWTKRANGGVAVFDGITVVTEGSGFAQLKVSIIDNQLFGSEMAILNLRVNPKVREESPTGTTTGTRSIMLNTRLHFNRLRFRWNATVGNRNCNQRRCFSYGWRHINVYDKATPNKGVSPGSKQIRPVGSERFPITHYLLQSRKKGWR